MMLVGLKITKHPWVKVKVVHSLGNRHNKSTGKFCNNFEITGILRGQN